MAIGILALIIGGILSAISASGIREVEPPKRTEKRIDYPFPKEI